MKKVFVLFLVAMMLLSFAPAAFGEEATPELISAEDADDGETGEEATEEEAEEVEEEAIDEETEEETELISESNFGAIVRLLQLERSVTKSYLTGKEVINVLSEKGEDVSELESILAEIEVLKDEVSALDPSSDSAVDDFANIKRDIKDLNMQFKRIASPLLSANDKQAIRDAIKDNEELAALNQRIRNALRELNANRVGKALDRMGAADPELVEQIESGDATPAEVRLVLKNAYGQLSPEDKESAKQRIRNAIKERNELRKKVAEKVKMEHLEVRKLRLENRLIKIPAANRAEVKARVDNAISKLKRVENRFKESIQTNRERLAKVKEDLNAKRANIREDFKERGEEIKAKVGEKIQDIKDSKVQVASNAEAKIASRQGKLQATSNTGGDAE
ncbi:MAG: hypothetical protein ABH840_01915 [Nanoarchaeota archaeon]